MYPRKETQFIILLGFLFLLVGSLVFVGLWQPIHFDEGVFLTIAREMNSGKKLYVDLFDHKSPGIFWVLCALLKFTSNIHLLRLVIALINSATVFVLFRTFRKTLSVKKAALLSIVFALSVYTYHGFFILTEVFVGFWLALFLYFFLKKSIFNSTTNQWLGGFCFGMALLFKQTVLFLFIPVLLFLLFHPTKAFKNTKALFAFLVGLSLPLLITFIYLQQKGLLFAWWESTVLFPVTNYPPARFLESLGQYIWIALPVLPAILALALNYRKMAGASFYLTLMLVSLIPTILFRPYHQYWLLLLPILIVLISYINLSNRWIYLLIAYSTAIGIVLLFYYSQFGINAYYVQQKSLLVPDCAVASPQAYWIRNCAVKSKYFFIIPQP